MATGLEPGPYLPGRRLLVDSNVPPARGVRIARFGVSTVLLLPRMKFVPLLAALVCAIPALSADPVIWRLDQPDKLGGHPLTVLGAPRLAADAEAPAMFFNGISDGIFVSANPLAGSAQFTIEILIKPEDGGLEAQRFFHLQDTATWRVMLETRLDGHGHWWLDTFLGKTGVSQPMIDPKLVHPTSRWYWIALRFDGARMTSFVNGEQELEREAVFGPMGDGQLSLGVRQNKVFWFKGGIREVRWHREALAKDKLRKL